MKIVIKLDYKKKSYVSKEFDLSEEDLQDLQKKIKDALNRNSSFIAFNNDMRQTYFFPQKIIQKSVITILHLEE